MSSVLLALLAGAVLLAFFAFRLRANSGSRSDQARSDPKHPYRCVSIREAPGGCAAVAWSKGRRFLPQEAPLLPAPGCPSRICQCSYRHHADRRSRARQRNAFDPRALTWAEQHAERRSTRHGRRRDD